MEKTQELLVRRLRYRLKCQGMLELDEWLAPLKSALELELNNPKVMTAIERLVSCEAPELLAMQSGTQPIPEELKPWLNI